MLVSTLDHSPYVGRIAIGRIERGSVTIGERVALLPHGEPGMVPEEAGEEAKVMKLFTYLGLERIDVGDRLRWGHRGPRRGSTGSRSA